MGGIPFLSLNQQCRSIEGTFQTRNIGIYGQGTEDNNKLSFFITIPAKTKKYVTQKCGKLRLKYAEIKN